MKSQKSPPAYVLDHRNGLKRHAMTPFAFADRYDPKQALEHTQCVSKILFQKNFGSSKSGTPFTKTLFLKVNHAILHQN